MRGREEERTAEELDHLTPPYIPPRHLRMTHLSIHTHAAIA